MGVVKVAVATMMLIAGNALAQQGGEPASPGDSLRRMDLPDNPTTPAILQPGMPFVTGTIDSTSDADWFGTDLKKGVSYALVSKGHEIYLELRGAKGELIKYVVTAPAAVSGFSFTVPADGRYYVGVANHLNGPDPYQISIVTEPGDNAYTNARATVGVPTNGLMDFPLDSDWFQISLQKDAHYRFDVAYQHRVEFFVRDSLGRILDYDPDAPESPFFNAPYTGSYFIEAVEATGLADFAYQFNVLKD